MIAVAFGGEDFTADLGLERLEDESQVTYARQKICVSARAAHVLALDTPYFKLSDPDGLRANALAAKSIGFKGKFAIHPDQIAELNECFSPSEQEVAHARARGRGVRGGGSARPRLDVARRLGDRRAGREARSCAARARAARARRPLARPRCESRALCGWREALPGLTRGARRAGRAGSSSRARATRPPPPRTPPRAAPRRTPAATRNAPPRSNACGRATGP